MTRVEHPHQIIIQQSIPFRMQIPAKQAELFTLLSRVFYYIASGYSKVGCLAADEWNPYYKREYNLHVTAKSLLYTLILR